MDSGAFGVSAVHFHFMQGEIPIAKWTDSVLLILGRRVGFEVSGDSMLPTLKTGDRVLVDPNAKIAVNDIVLANHPYKKSVRIIKRVAMIDSDGNYFLTGENPDESTDSKTFGKIPARNVLGKVVARMRLPLAPRF